MVDLFKASLPLGAFARLTRSSFQQVLLDRIKHAALLKENFSVARAFIYLALLQIFE